MRSTVRIVAVAAVIALVGCGNSGDTEEAADTTSAREVTDEVQPTTTSTTENGPTESAGAGEFTPQGTELAFGEVATVPFSSNEQAGAIGVTVVDIKAGTERELSQLDLGDRVSGFTPYYVTFEVTNESGSDFSFSALGNTHGLLEDGTRAQSVGIIGEFAPCPNNAAGSDFTTEGASYTTCSVELAPSGTSVVGAAYTSHDTDVDAPNTNYDEDPIVWR